MIPKCVLCCFIVFIVLVAGCGVCAVASAVTRDGYPTAGFQTTFSIDYTEFATTDKVRVSIYMLTPPKNEAEFTRIAKQYIGSTLGNEFSNTLGNEFKGRKATHVEVIGAYENEVLVMSRKVGDKEAAFNKYEPVSGWGWYNDERYRIETLPSELAQHLTPVTPQSAPAITDTLSTKAQTSIQISSSTSALGLQEVRYMYESTYQLEPISSGPCSCDRDSYNCCDFPNQAAAQACYDYCMSQTGRDIHDLSRGGGQPCSSDTTARNCGWVR